MLNGFKRKTIKVLAQLITTIEHQEEKIKQLEKEINKLKKRRQSPIRKHKEE
ncbi:hypothetical protein ACNQ17_00655 [Mycoplasma sp. Sp48II]|uniref:hypothetical protein n=1 Tax=Mycoplasma sp. Sp48II TaxID=3401682 RepID=UPI003AACA186